MNDITEDTLASDVIFIHAVADKENQNDIAEDTLASYDVTFIHAIADEGKPAFL